ncbi:phage tail spike protein [Lacticaseibacillus paracasei]|uniref:phage tail spike protein n=1 Tax=Lacticaseibacillus paracasei TaxID=1597 RepID=UPI0021A442A5|nr:phage tail spike protein [Lacticaseibacillus paracasei]MCT4386391.1 hypothetical protein [Lacticaseibacillus paracasei]
MILYFTKHPSFELVGTASTSQTEAIWVSDNGGQEGEYRSIAGGYRSYGATVYFQPDQSAHVKEMTEPGNYILYKDHNGDSVWLTILTCEHDPLAGRDTITAEDASMDLINETVGAYSAPKAMTISDYINLFVTDSGFDIGTNEIPTLARTLTWESDESTALARILSVATQFDAELDFRFEISGLTVIKKYIDIYKSIGKDRRTELTVNVQLNDLVTSTDVSNLYTAVYAIGSTPEGADSPITLKGYQWTDPDNRFVLLSDGSLRDPVANQSWSRLVGKDALTGGFINRVKTYEAQTQATLLQSALSDLKKYNHPTVTYTVDIAMLPDDVQVGDTVHLRDEQEQLFLTARVLELTYSYSTESGTATLGDYLIETSQIDPAYRALAETLAKQNKGKDGVGIQSSIVTYQAGVSGTTAPTGVWSEAVPTVSPSQFLWSRTVLTMTDGSSSTTYSVGKIGDNGAAGADGNGIKSSAVTYQVGTSGTTAPTGTWSSSVPTASQGTYLWSRVITTYTNGTQNTSYSVAYQGTNGTKGDPGSKDVPMTYIQETQPSGTIVTNSLWWVGATMSSVTALKRWDGSSWIPDTIAQAVLNVVALNAVTITGSTFQTTFNGHPYDPTGQQDQSLWVRGDVTIGDGKLSMDTTFSNTQNGTSTATSNTTIGYSSMDTSYKSSNIATYAHLIGGQLFLSSTSNGVNRSGVLDADWLQRVNAAGTQVWSGALFPSAVDRANCSIPLNQTYTGWLIRWSYYASGNQNNYYNYTLLPNIVTRGKTNNLYVTISMPGVGTFFKRLWWDNTGITGSNDNAAGSQEPHAVMDAIFAV